MVLANPRYTSRISEVTPSGHFVSWNPASVTILVFLLHEITASVTILVFLLHAASQCDHSSFFVACSQPV